MKIILGLGNIGEQYQQTRHNAGFMVLDYLAKKQNANWLESKKFRGFVTEIHIGTEKVILLKPTTFYNLTGFALRQIVNFYKLDINHDVIVIHDDLSLDFGTLKVRQIGSAGGNNGVRSIIGDFGTNFWRIKIGISNQKQNLMSKSDFVLSKFSTDEIADFSALTKQTCLIIEDFINNKIENTTYTL